MTFPTLTASSIGIYILPPLKDILLLGFFGGHKFYERKIGMGILYFFAGELFLIGAVIDFFAILAKPNSYYV